jgi:hypothetical protein
VCSTRKSKSQSIPSLHVRIQKHRRGLPRRCFCVCRGLIADGFAPARQALSLPTKCSGLPRSPWVDTLAKPAGWMPLASVVSRIFRLR